MNTQEYEYHEIANIFPMLEAPELGELTEDIRRNGLREPIWLYQGKILDGRNRYEACKHAWVYPEFREYEGEDPVGFVVSLNLHRRHLSESQRGMVGASIARLEKGSNQHGGKVDAQICASSIPTQEQVAGMLNVGRTTIQSARKVQDSGTPELVAEVVKGNVAVSTAAKLAELPKEEQVAIVAEGPQAVREAVAARHARTIGTGNNEWYTPEEYIQAARQVLGEIDTDPASNEQAQQWVKAKTFYTAETNGLEREWRGKVWMNPPYSQPLMSQFIDKLQAHIESGEVTEAIVLSHNNTDTQWFHKLASSVDAICLTKGRIAFINGTVKAAPTQGQCFYYFGKNKGRFDEVFSEFGACFERVRR